MEKREFVRFLSESGALQFGRFVNKSGRTCPYFLNMGAFDDGTKLTTLATAYADTVRSQFGSVDTVYAPSSKSIPTAVATAEKLNCGFTFSRKETDGGNSFVGTAIYDGERIVLTEDVLTSGRTVLDHILLLRRTARVQLLGLVIAVDRLEKGSAGGSLLEETAKNIGLPILPIITLDDVIENTDSPQKEELLAYHREFGA